MSRSPSSSVVVSVPLSIVTSVYALDNKDVVGTWYANSLSMDGMNEFHPNAIMMEMSMEISEDGNGKVTTSSESEEADVNDFEWKIDGDNIIITSDDEVMEGTYEDGKITISMDGMTVTLGQEKEEYQRVFRLEPAFQTQTLWNCSIHHQNLQVWCL